MTAIIADRRPASWAVRDTVVAIGGRARTRWSGAGPAPSVGRAHRRCDHAPGTDQDDR